jgi:hypothetical protein
MADFISGVETELSKGFQRLESVGSTLLEDTESVISHPIQSLERVGSATLGALRRGAGYLEDAAEQVVYHPVQSLESAGSATVGAIKRGATYLEETAEDVYDKLMVDASNLNKVVTSHLPPHHTRRMVAPSAPAPTAVVPAPRRAVAEGTMTRRTLKTIVNWTIVLLVLLLIGVIVYLTCKRYSLAGTSLMSGDRTMAAALLTPELSAGLSTLAATL